MIPKDTVFAAAEHITTLDELRWLYVPELSDAAQEAFNRIEAALPKVSDEANAERITQLPNLGSPITRIRRLRQNALQRIGVRYARNGDWRVTPRLSSGTASLPKSAIWVGELFSTIITGRRIKTVHYLPTLSVGRERLLNGLTCSITRLPLHLIIMAAGIKRPKP